MPLNGGQPVSISYRVATQGVNVGRRADFPVAASSLLRRHVTGRAQDVPRLGLPVLDLQPLRQAKVRHLGGSIGIEEHVRRLQVAMDNAHPVGRVHRGGDVCE